MAPKAFNQKTVYCSNPACVHFQVQKVVSLPLVGSGIYLGGPIYCECGYQGEMRLFEEE